MKLPATYRMPQYAFDVGHIAAQRSCVCCGFFFDAPFDH